MTDSLAMLLILFLILIALSPLAAILVRVLLWRGWKKQETAYGFTRYLRFSIGLGACIATLNTLNYISAPSSADLSTGLSALGLMGGAIASGVSLFKSPRRHCIVPLVWISVTYPYWLIYMDQIINNSTEDYRFLLGTTIAVGALLSVVSLWSLKRIGWEQGPRILGCRKEHSVESTPQPQMAGCREVAR